MNVALLSAFNPHDFSAATVRTVATGRDEVLKDILSTIRSNIGAETIQHLIISAPRGYGKSFMMRHIQIEVERITDDEKLALAVGLMPEEMPHVTEPETLIRELTRALTGGAGADAGLTWHEDEGAVWEATVDELKAAIHQKVGERGLFVALVENFDVLLRRAFSKEVQASRLRAFLTEPDGRLMLIAASASGAFDRDYDGRLFQGFREVVLEPWSIEECLAFFDRQRTDAGKPPLDEMAGARAKAVASFIGGTPRLATLLGDTLFDEDILRAADLLNKLVDELTPYYKERIEALPGRSQKLLDALLRGGEPATQSELARRVRANSQAAIAGPFNALVSERIVFGEKAPASAEVLYRVADRVFAHYYRRRIVDHGKTACPLEALVDLLAAYFSPREKQTKAGEFARRGRIAEARVMARLHDADRGTGKGARVWILHGLGNYNIPARLLPLATETIADHLRAIADLAKSDAIDQAYARVEAASSLTNHLGDRVLLLLVRSGLDAYEGIDGGLSAAEEAVTTAEPLSDKRFDLVAKLGRTWSLQQLGRYAEAFDLVAPLVDLASKAGDLGTTAAALRYAAYSLGELGRHEEAVTAARQAADLALKAGDVRGRVIALRHAAFSVDDLGRHEEALTALRQAADLALKAGDVGEQAFSLCHTGFSLGELGRHEEALIALGQAADLALKAGDMHAQAVALRHAAISLWRLGRYEEAVTTARQAANVAYRAGDAHEQSLAFDVLAKSLVSLNDHMEAIWALGMAAKIIDGYGDEKLERVLVATADWLGRQASTSLFGSAGDLDRLHAFLRATTEHLDFDGVARTCLQTSLQALAETAMGRIQDADNLEAWATAIELRFPGRFGGEISRLRDAARYHGSGRDPAALARLDPDVSRTLRTLFPPRDDAPPVKRRKSSGRRGR